MTWSLKYFALRAFPFRRLANSFQCPSKAAPSSLRPPPLLDKPGSGVLDVRLLLNDQTGRHTTELMVLSQYVHLVLSLQHVLVYGHHVTWVGVEELT